MNNISGVRAREDFSAGLYKLRSYFFPHKHDNKVAL